MPRIDCIQSPLSIHPTPESLVWDTSATISRVTDTFPTRRIDQEHKPLRIDFAEYSITNTILARGCIGMLELGILRNPDDLVALLEDLNQYQTESQENPTFHSILLGVLAANNPGVRDNVMGYFEIAGGHLSKIYRDFMPSEFPLRFDELIDRAIQLDDQQTGLNFVETFIKTYVGIRRAVTGYGESYHRKHSDEEKRNLYKRLNIYVDKKLNILAEEYRKAFKTDRNEYMQKREPTNLAEILKDEIKSGDRILDEVQTCPASHRLSEKASYGNRQDDLTTLTDITTGRRLTSELHHRVDEVTPVKLRSGKVIHFYNMRACPFIAHGNHPI